MELPKNITQIGEADRACKVYVEDYVVSYMKQLCRQTQEKGLAIALYGKYTKEQGLSYFFIYGACKVLSISKEVRHLSQAQNQEVERLRQQYFPEYAFVGYHIFDGEMVEGMHIQEQDACRYIKGYACFYEKNDSMLAYMVDNKTHDYEPEQYGQEKYDRARARQEERRSQYGQRGQQSSEASPIKDKPGKNREAGGQDAAQASSLKMMRMSAAAVFAVLCLIGVAAITREDGEGSLGERARQLWAQFADERPEPGEAPQEGTGPQDGEASQGDAAREAAAQVYNSGTLKAENNLADAILQENQQATAVSGQAVAGLPRPDGEDGQPDAPQGENAAGQGAQGLQEASGLPPSQGQPGDSPGEPGQQGLGGQSQQGLGEPGQQGLSEPGQQGQDMQGQQGQETPGQGQPGQETPGQDPPSQDPSGGGSPTEIPAQGPSVSEIEAQQSQRVSYVIQAGDTLIGISTRQYGNDSYVQAICELNGITNPDNIQIGQKILLP